MTITNEIHEIHCYNGDITVNTSHHCFVYERNFIGPFLYKSIDTVISYENGCSEQGATTYWILNSSERTNLILAASSSS